jgi:hypothetical protein
MSLSASARFRPNSDVLERAKQAAFARVLARAQELTRFKRCPEHGASATIKLDGESLKVSGCCEKFRREVAKGIVQK